MSLLSCKGCNNMTYDSLYLYNAADMPIANYTGNSGSIYLSNTVWDSPALKIRFVSDCCNTSSGIRLNFTLGILYFDSFSVYLT